MQFESAYPLVPLKKLVEFVNGDRSSNYPSTRDHDLRGVPFISATDIAEGRIELASVKRISRAAFERLRSGRVRRGDILLCIRGSLGKLGVVSDFAEGAIASSLVILRSAEPAVLRYLRYVLSGAAGVALLSSLDNGSVQGNISVASLKEVAVPLPPGHTIEAIASLMGQLDEGIDLLRQTNATLESIAQALFKSWFIDFDPVRAKAEGREPEGMDAATAALFPAEFDESALGLIPKGWSVRSVDSFATYLNGLALQKYPPESDDEFLPVIKIAQLRAGHTNGAHRASARLKPEYVVRDGDVLFSWSGSLEVEFWCGGDGALNQHLFKVTSSDVPKWFYYLATKHFLPGFREIAAHKATTMGHIQRGHLTEARLALPPATAMQAISPLVAPLLERRVVGALQARELAAVRDSLLPRLISGKLRLPEARERIDEALT